MKVLDKRCMCSMVCMASYSYDGEYKIEDDNGEIYYLHLNYFDGKNFTVSKDSIFNYLVEDVNDGSDVKFSEEYTSLSRAKKSKFYELFRELDQFVQDLVDEKIEEIY
jgi:hypothetical protein